MARLCIFNRPTNQNLNAKNRQILPIFCVAFKLFLPLSHSAPIYEAVEVVDEEDGKADRDREVGKIVERCQNPQNYKDNVICGI